MARRAGSKSLVFSFGSRDSSSTNSLEILPLQCSHVVRTNSATGTAVFFSLFAYEMHCPSQRVPASCHASNRSPRLGFGNRYPIIILFFLVSSALSAVPNIIRNRPTRIAYDSSGRTQRELELNRKSLKRNRRDESG